MIETDRLHLRAWRRHEAAAYHAVAAQAGVAAMLGSAPTLIESRARIGRQNASLAANGFCFWAVERAGDRRVIGWCGLQFLPEALGGEVEIGWAIAPDLWGQGYAREAAAAVLGRAWATTTLPRLLAITTPGNARSRGLMERLGMIRLADGDFDHPALAPGDPLRRHLTYAIERPR